MAMMSVRGDSGRRVVAGHLFALVVFAALAPASCGGKTMSTLSTTGPGTPASASDRGDTGPGMSGSTSDRGDADNTTAPATSASDRSNADSATKAGSASGGGSSSSNGGCRSAADCSLPDSFDDFCWNGAPLGLPFNDCGELWQQSCQTDSDCADAGPSEVCVPRDVCGGTQCAPKCMSDSDCPLMPAGAYSCLTNGHCGATPCAAASDCPVDYVCVAHSCGPKCCASDSDCVGFCVNGACSSQLGACFGSGSGGPTPGVACTPGP